MNITIILLLWRPHQQAPPSLPRHSQTPQAFPLIPRALPQQHHPYAPLVSPLLP